MTKWQHLEGEFTEMLIFYGYYPSEDGFNRLCREFDKGRPEAIEMIFNMQSDHMGHIVDNGIH